MKILNEKNVNEAVLNCLFNDDEIDEKGEPLVPYTKGVVGHHEFCFHPMRLHESKEIIIELLNQLSEEFFILDSGESMAKAMFKENGEAWTLNLTYVEGLLALGNAIKRVECVTPESMWSVMPVGLPFFKIIK